MSKKYIEDNLETLRKQRDENVVGGYRDLVVKTYKYIQQDIKKSKTDFCNPKNSDISKAIYGNRNQERKIRGYINDLRKSGYISIYGIGLEQEVKITKELDF
ncbi:MAG: hypothetical protein JEZ05_10600 [Tenericutes bacterium]|nr:hypothetical protein [Mycoplasmatota bacterium]